MTSIDTSTAPARHAVARRRARRGITPLAIVLGVATIGAGSAYAYWTIGGSGTGSAVPANGLVALTTTATAAVGDLLFPGSNSVPLSLKINNPGVLPVIINAVTANGAITSDKTGCAGTNVTFTPATNLSITVAAGSSTTTSVAHLVSMSATAPNACQGATFTIPVTLSGRNP
jgi:hypothetical protein